MTQRNFVDRRKLLLGGVGISAAAALAACTSNENPTAAQTKGPAAGTGNDAPGKKVVIGFSAPAADHGWIAAITNNAKPASTAFRIF